MKIIIAAPLYPPEVGGPASYAKVLNDGFLTKGHQTTLVKFSYVRDHPTILRHFLYFWRVLSALRKADIVLGFDTWSTGMPSLIAAKLLHKKMIVRIGGDFLWEEYVQRTHKLVRFSEFYSVKKNFSVKEWFIFVCTRWFTRHASALIFNTKFQKDMWEVVYKFNPKNATVIENQYPEERDISLPRGRVFVAAGRANFLKNTKSIEIAFRNLKRSFPDIELDLSLMPIEKHEERIKNSYAVVIPSLSEMSPNTAIEAIKYGKPFIMTQDSGAIERLANVGIFVDTLNVAELQQSMEKLLDPIEYENACERVKSFTFSHSWKEIVQEFISVITSICAS